MTILRRKQPYRVRPLHSRWTHRPAELPAAPPPPPPDYIVSGFITPNATGGYIQNGTHLGKPLYQLYNGAFFLWWTGYRDFWCISLIPGLAGPGWSHNAPGIEGDYDPNTPYTGIATVIAA